MFKELLELGKRLDLENKLPPVSYYIYEEPVSWVLHVWRDDAEKFDIRKTEITSKARPFSGRTSGAQAHLASDEASYVLGKGGDSTKKRRKFMLLLRHAERHAKAVDQQLAQSIHSARSILVQNKCLDHPKWSEIKPKEWVSIQVEETNQHLIDHPLIQSFWHRTIKQQCLPNTQSARQEARVPGQCSLTNKAEPLVHRIALKVRLWKPTPLHSLNANAFLSGICEKDAAHIGQSFEAGDLIARTLNYLRSQSLHHKILAKAIEAGKLNTDSPQNLFAFYWIELAEKVQGSLSIDPNELLSKATLFLGGSDDGETWKTDNENEAPATKRTTTTNLPIDLSQLEALLNIPWTGQQHALRIDDNAFCLVMLSPNKGRISIREWLKVGLGHLKVNLKTFIDAQRIEAPDGSDPRCFAISDLLRALEKSNISQPENKAKELGSPNIARALLRCCYLGEAPPAGLLEPAVICFRRPKILRRYEQKSERERFARLQHQLAAVMKLILTHPKSEVRMTGDTERNLLGGKNPAFLSGCLLAVLEEAQLASASWKINTTIIDQFYSTAASAPCTVLGMLVSRVTSQHMPKLRKNLPGKYAKLESLLESIQDDLHSLGGFPKILTLKQQAEFSLGFYAQRAAFSRERPPRKTTQTNGQPLAEQGA